MTPKATSARIIEIKKIYKNLLFELRCLTARSNSSERKNISIFKENKQLETALEYIKRNPKYLPARIRACELLFSLGHYYQAYEYSKKVLKIKQLKNLHKIKQLSYEFLTLNHGFSTAAENLYQESKYKKANQAIREALRAHPKELSALLIALKIFVARKKWVRAEAIAKELQKTHPNRPESYYFFCDYARKKSDLKLALRIAKEASNNFPNDQQFKIRLNKIREAYEKKRDLSNALKATLTIQKSFQMTDETYWHLCRYLIALGRQDDAYKMANKFLSDFPTSLRGIEITLRLTDEIHTLQQCLNNANKSVEKHPHEADGYAYVYKILNLLGRRGAALTSLAHGLRCADKKSKLLVLASNIDLSSGHKKESIKVIERLIQADPCNDKYHNRKLRLLLSHGLASAAKYHAENLLIQKDDKCNYIFKENLQGKDLDRFARNILNEHENQLQPQWIHSYQTFQSIKENLPRLSHQPFQYWSQGNPPEEILKLTDQWNHELKKIGLNNIILFDRKSALNWISANTPEFLEPFNSSFHYAVEADVFRIAYAIKNDCIWIDADMIISESVAATLAQRILSADTTLYMKEVAPLLSNGFFATKKSSPFFMNIMNEMKNYTFNGKIPSERLVLDSFGTARYTNTLTSLMEENGNIKKHSDCKNSYLNLNGWKINFVNKATFGRSKPDEGLEYFQTKDNWNNFLSDYTTKTNAD